MNCASTEGPWLILPREGGCGMVTRNVKKTSTWGMYEPVTLTRCLWVHLCQLELCATAASEEWTIHRIGRMYIGSDNTKQTEPRNNESMHQGTARTSVPPPPAPLLPHLLALRSLCSGSGSPLNGHSFCLDEQASGSGGSLQVDHRDVDLGNESGSSGSEEDAERPGPFEADEAGENGALNGVGDREPRLFESLLSVRTKNASAVVLPRPDNCTTGRFMCFI